MRGSLLGFAACLAVSALSVHAQSPLRRALFFINTDYKALAPLKADDAAMTELKAALTAAKFEGTEKGNLPQDRMAKFEESDYGKGVKKGDILVLYYFGYALQARGDNWLVPVDFDPAATERLSFRASSLNGFIQLLDEKQVGLKFVFIDTRNELVAGATRPGPALPHRPDISH